MTDKNRQEISGATDSNINQAGGDIVIYQGMDPVKVVEICTAVVKSQMEIYEANAKATAWTRFNSFSDAFCQRLEQVEEKVREKLNDPGVQIALNESIVSSIGSGDKELQEDLIDLMIERMEHDGRDTRRFLIDEARKVLPRINKTQLAFLALKVFVGIRFGKKASVMEKVFYNDLAPILKECKEVSDLDLNYLGQAGCIANPFLYMNERNVTQGFRENYELLFHPGYTIDEINEIIRENPITQEENVNALGQLIRIENGVLIKFIPVRFDIIERLKDKYPTLITMLKALKESKPSFSVEKIKRTLTEAIPEWSRAIEFLDNEGKNAFLSPLGQFLGLRYLSKVTGFNLDMTIFYPNS